MVCILKIQIINQLPSDTAERVNNGVKTVNKDACKLFVFLETLFQNVL